MVSSLVMYAKTTSVLLCGYPLTTLQKVVKLKYATLLQKPIEYSASHMGQNMISLNKLNVETTV
eukprot:m.98329 g.98329  ORF g.98329 m.98329 type:complete len:64 (-) comp27053_c0_seq1:349-540(-)